MVNMFKLSDIKAGYLLVVEDGGKHYNMTVVPNKNDALGCCCPAESQWFPLGCFNENLEYLGARIMSVYGRTFNAGLLSNQTSGRTLLWKRPLVRLTYKEIEERLGFKFEYVEEEEWRQAIVFTRLRA